MRTVAITGTFDSKGEEYFFLKQTFEEMGIQTLTIHTGVFAPYFEPDIDNAEVFAAGGADRDAIVAGNDRAAATKALSEGLAAMLPKLYAEGKFDGIISLGGSGGTSIASAGMRALPIGMPKILVSTMASGDTRRFVGSSDIIMMPSVLDVAGLNSISKMVFRKACAAMAGMLTWMDDSKASEEKDGQAKTSQERPCVGATMYGITTKCINMAKAYLEEHGYEVMVFHATGVGGQTMENLVRSGFFKGVLDVTTTEWCDEICGGNLSAGPHRGEAASVCGVPQVVTVGAMDTVAFGSRDSIPSKYDGRLFYQHNPATTLMRMNEEESDIAGQKLSEKWSMADPDKISVFLPLKSVSLYDEPGGPFHNPKTDGVLFDSIRTHLDKDIPLVEMDNHINDETFALAMAKRLIELMEADR